VKIVTVVGARPQFIKSAPVSRAIQEHNRDKDTPQIEEILVHTGQHYDHNMSQVFFDELQIRKPDHHLGVGSGSHGQMTGAMLQRIEKVLFKEKPDLVLVYGDTNSTLAGALAAAKLCIPIAHVEAGLRSFNGKMPEEINRAVTDRISTLLFCPTDTAVVNLRREGITQGVHNVGDVMYDSFLFNRGIAEKKSVILSELKLEKKSYFLATVHRQENTEDLNRLSKLFAAFQELATADCPIVIPLHPRTRKLVHEHWSEKHLSPYVRIVAPVSYTDMIALEVHARVILTDSGGMQKEAYFAGVPCVTLREETEWVETLKGGWNLLAGVDPQTIIGGCQETRILSSDARLDAYGDGQARYHIVRLLLSCSRQPSAHLGLS
jgi:UDP-N-acetylglucosamine 2-epimerase